MAATNLHYTQDDFNLIPFLNAVAEPVAGSVTPSAANIGRFYRNTSTKRLEFVLDSATIVSMPYSGSIVDADIASGANIAIAKLAVNPLARANHTGTQVAATISDFDTQVNTHKPTDLALITSAFNFNGQQAKQMADPSEATDGVTLQYLQAALAAAIAGKDWKDAVNVAPQTATNLASPGATLDGVTMTAGMRFLETQQSNAANNGIYVWNGASTAATRSADANTSAAVTSGMAMYVLSGSKANNEAFLTTPDPITLGTTGLTFMITPTAQAYVQGTGIVISGQTISLAVPVSVANGGTGGTTAAAARSALGTNAVGNVTAIGALTAGTELSVTHGLNTQSLILQVRQVANKQVVFNIAVRSIDANNAGITASVAVSSGTLELVALPASS